MPRIHVVSSLIFFLRKSLIDKTNVCRTKLQRIVIRQKPLKKLFFEGDEKKAKKKNGFACLFPALKSSPRHSSFQGFFMSETFFCLRVRQIWNSNECQVNFYFNSDRKWIWVMRSFFFIFSIKVFFFILWKIERNEWKKESFFLLIKLLNHLIII